MTTVSFRHHPATDVTRHRVLLLHGLGNSATVWKSYVDHRASDVEAWSVELPWRGGGDPSWSHSGDVLRWVGQVLRDAPGQADVLVAHSFAASLVLEFLSQAHATGVDPLAAWGVKGLVLVSPFYRRSPQDFGWEVVSGLSEKFLTIIGEGIRLHSPRRLDPELQLDLARRVCERVGPYGWIRFGELYLSSPWLRTDLITAPCLVVTGTNDATTREAADLAADLPSGSLVRLPGCGHFPMLERPAEFTGAVASFLTEQRSLTDA